MSKSKHPKWFNPTGLAIWDEYYEFAWPVVILPCSLLVIVLVVIFVRSVL